MQMKIKDMPSVLPGLMASGREFHYTINIRMELTEEIDPEQLQKAVEKARERYPYYFVRLERDAAGELQLTDNPVPVVVRPRLEPPMLLSEESNGHIQAFTCEGKVLWHHIHHAFSDGTSDHQFLQTVLYLYFSEKYHRSFACPGVHLPGEPISPEETRDPLLSYAAELEAQLKNGMLTMTPPPAGFGWKSKYMTDKKPTVFYMTVPENAFVKYSKDKDSSPATLPAVFMARSVFALHGEDLPIRASIMANTRMASGNKAFMGSGFGQIGITYPPKLRNWDVQRIATVTRGAVILQTGMDALREQTRQIAALDTVANRETDKKAAKAMLSSLYAPAEKDSSMTVGCSYPGAIQWGELNDFLTSFHVFVDPSSELMSFFLVVAAVHGKIFLTFIQNFTSDVYVKQFQKELEKEGIECTCSEAQPGYYARTKDIEL